MEPKVETPKLYISQILNLQVLEEDQIEKIQTMSDTDKMEIIKYMNEVIQSLIYVLMLP
jgi:hypothetical protein